MAAFTSKSQIFPFTTLSGFFPDPATQQADVYKQVAPGFKDSPLVNQYMPNRTMSQLLQSVSSSTGRTKSVRGTKGVKEGFGKELPTTSAAMSEEDRNKMILLYALSGALRGKSPIESGLALKQQLKQQELQQRRDKIFQELAKDPKYADKIRLIEAEIDPRMLAGASSLERFTLYSKNTGKPVKTISKSEAEDIDKDKYIIGPLADPFPDNLVGDDIETWAVTDREGNRVTDLINPTEEELKNIVSKDLFINKTPALTSAGKAKDTGIIEGWNDEGGLENRAITYNSLVNAGQRIINNLYANPGSVLATGDIAQAFDQIKEEFAEVGAIFNVEERNSFISKSPEGQNNARIREQFKELAKQTAITESQLLDFAYQIAKVRGQEGRGLSDQDFKNFQKIISAGRTAEQKAAALHDFITGVGVEIKTELDYTRELKNLIIGRNPDDENANAIVSGINDLYAVGFGQINNPFIQQPTQTPSTTDGIQRIRIRLN